MKRTPKISVGAQVEVSIDGLDDDGAGTTQIGGNVLVVPGGAPGDRLVVQVEHNSPHTPKAWARVVEPISRGSDFASPSCPHSWPVRGGCGGCPLMHLGAGAQDSLKRRLVTKFVPADSFVFEPPKRRLGYRNRCHFVASRPSRRSKVRLGSYRPRTHEVVSMRGCPVVREPIRRVHGVLEDVLSDLRVPVHPSEGGLRYATVRGSQNDELLVELVAGSFGSDWLEDAARNVMQLPEVVGVSFSVNEGAGNAIRGGPPRPVFGQRSIVERYGPLEVELTPGAFAQLNTDVAVKMYEAAADVLCGAAVLWDIYCGAGLIGLTAAVRKGGPRSVWGAEITAGAVESARAAADKVGVDARYDAVDLSRSAPSDWPEADAVVVNPPRRGLDEPVLAWLKRSNPERLVYMSCNPQSFARDAAELSRGGYEIRSVVAYDMLPQTTHVELLGVLAR